MELELMAWGDGTIRLSFEDSIHGDDRTFVLNADGTAHESTYGDDDSEVLTPVDLVLALREMAQEARQ